MKYICNLCGWVYDEEETGVKWEDLPEDFACELCGAGKEDFSPVEEKASFGQGTVLRHRPFFVPANAPPESAAVSRRKVKAPLRRLRFFVILKERSLPPLKKRQKHARKDP